MTDFESSSYIDNLIETESFSQVDIEELIKDPNFLPMLKDQKKKEIILQLIKREKSADKIMELLRTTQDPKIIRILLSLFLDQSDFLGYFCTTSVELLEKIVPILDLPPTSSDNCYRIGFGTRILNKVFNIYYYFPAVIGYFNQSSIIYPTILKHLDHSAFVALTDQIILPEKPYIKFGLAWWALRIIAPSQKLSLPSRFPLFLPGPIIQTEQQHSNSRILPSRDDYFGESSKSEERERILILKTKTLDIIRKILENSPESLKEREELLTNCFAAQSDLVRISNKYTFENFDLLSFPNDKFSYQCGIVILKILKVLTKTNDYSKIDFITSQIQKMIENWQNYDEEFVAEAILFLCKGVKTPDMENDEDNDSENSNNNEEENDDEGNSHNENNDNENSNNENSDNEINDNEINDNEINNDENDDNENNEEEEENDDEGNLHKYVRSCLTFIFQIFIGEKNFGELTSSESDEIEYEEKTHSQTLKRALIKLAKSLLPFNVHQQLLAISFCCWSFSQTMSLTDKSFIYLLGMIATNLVQKREIPYKKPKTKKKSNSYSDFTDNSDLLDDSELSDDNGNSDDNSEKNVEIEFNDKRINQIMKDYVNMLQEMLKGKKPNVATLKDKKNGKMVFRNIFTSSCETESDSESMNSEDSLSTKVFVEENDKDKEIENENDKEKESDNDKEIENDHDEENENDKENENDNDKEIENDKENENDNDKEIENDHDEENESDNDKENENDNDKENKNDNDKENKNDKPIKKKKTSKKPKHQRQRVCKSSKK